MAKSKKKAKKKDSETKEKLDKERTSDEEENSDAAYSDDMTDDEFEDYLDNLNNGYSDGGEYSDYPDYGETQAEPEPETEAAAADAAEAEAQGNTPFKVFDSEDDYNRAMEEYAQNTYGDRLRAGDAAQGELDSLKDYASRYYDDGEADPLGRLRGDLESQTAERMGQTTEEYRQAEQDRKDLEAYRAQQAQIQSTRDGRQAIVDRWHEEETRLKQSVPDFDLEAALDNEEFRQMLIGGASVDGAYYAVKYNEMKNAPPQTAQREPIMQNAAQTGTKPGAGVNDLLSQNDGDFRKSLRRIMDNG